MQIWRYPSNIPTSWDAVPVLSGDPGDAYSALIQQHDEQLNDTWHVITCLVLSWGFQMLWVKRWELFLIFIVAIIISGY